MAQDLLKAAYIQEFCLTPWTSWPFQAFPANYFPSFTHKQILAARNAWGFFEAVEAYDAQRRLILATQSVIGVEFVTDPNLWYELEIESEYDEYKYGQYLHSLVCPEISWTSQRHLVIPTPGTELILELLVPYPILITNVIAFAQDKAALVVWPRSTEPIISYTVTSSPGNKSVVAQPGAEALRMTDLTNGIPYTFTVTVKNTVGLTSTSAPSAPVIPHTNPQPPTDVSATTGLLSASLTWLAPLDNGGGPITTYTVVSNPGNVIVDVSGLSATVSGLQGGSTYFFTVTATNSFGLDSLPTRSNSVTILSTPDPPVSIIGTPGPSSALVTWSPPPYTGGVPITTYTVMLAGQTRTVTDLSASFTGLINGSPYTASVTTNNQFGSSAIAYSNVFRPLASPDPPVSVAVSYQSVITANWPASNPQGSPILNYTVSLLDPSSNIVETKTVTTLSTVFSTFILGTAYRVSVRATNAVGVSAARISGTVVPATRPSVPPGLSVQTVDSSATLLWSAPYNGGSPITEYRVSLGPLTQTVTDLSATFTGLSYGVSYTMSVIAVNSVGSSPAAVSTTFMPRGKPDPPVSVAVSYQSVIVANWPASNPQGSPVTSYTVNLLDPSSNIVETKTVTTLTTVFSTFILGTAYRVSVRATNAVGVSDARISGTVVPATRPSAPTGLSVQISDSSATLLWVRPYDGGSSITEYRVSLGPQTQTVTDLSATFSGLSYGVSYTMSVIAVNSIGSSPAAISNTFMPTAKPVTPVSVTVSYQSVITANWPASNPQGSPVTSYTVNLLDPSSNVVETKTVTTLTTVFSTFILGTAYRVSVRATNAVGVSDARISGTVVPATRPSVPPGLSIQVSDSSATLLWATPYDGGSPITGYRVSIKPGLSLQAQTVTDLSATFTGLINGTTYEFTVVAINSVGVSGPTSILGTPYGPPSVPIGVQATPSAGSVNVTWFPPAYTGGYPLTAYTVSGYDVSGTQLSTITVPIYSPLAVNYTGLRNGTLYTFTVTVFTSKGSSSSTVTATPFTIPDPPIDLSGVNVADSIVLTWKPPLSTGGSPILDYMVTISPGCSILYTSDLTASFSDLISGTLYTFVVSAINVVGPSVAAQLTMMHITAPSVPRNISLTMGAKTALMVWSPPASNGGIPLTSYTVNVLDPSGTTVSSYSDLSASVLFSGLSDNTAYSFIIFCTNTIGSSASQTFSGVTADFPSVPRNITASAGIGAVNLAWTAPSSNGRTPILTYTITTYDSSGTLVSTNSNTTLSYQVTGLTNGVLYTFGITAVNAVGSGPTGTIQARPIGQPSPPRSLVITAGKGSLALTWSAPSSNGGLSITGYTVTTNAAPVRTVTDLSASYTGLTNGTTYTFSVVASNGILTSTAATISGIPGAVPSVPLSLATTRSDGSIGLSWTIPSDTGGLTLLSYTVVATDSLGTVATPSIAMNSGGGSVSFTGLTNGTLYTFTVAANNTKGSGPSATISDTPGAPPSAPTSLTATASSGSILLGWSPPANLGGFPITSYTAAYGGATITGLTGLTYTFTGLTNGTTYTFTVTATNARGTSAAVSISGIPLGSPSVPLNLTAVGGNSSLVVSWSAPSINGGAPITSYVVIVTNTSTGGVLTNPTINNTGSGGNATYTGLTNGIVYSVSVAAVAASTGPPATTTGLAGTVPGSPTSLSQTSGSRQVTVSWAAPLDNGGSAITSYTVSVYGTIFPNVGSPYTITNLTNGGVYPINIRAINIFGSSTPAIINGTAIGTPTIPTNLVGTPGDTTVTLSWAAPADHGGFAITNYYINYTNPTTSVTSNIDVGPNTNRLITGLTNGTGIVFTVTAFNGFLTGPGAIVTVTPAPATTVPGPPGRLPNISGTGGFQDVFFLGGYKTQLYNFQQTYLNPNYTNLLSGVPSGEDGLIIAWFAPANGGLPIDYYNINVERFGQTTTTTVTALSNEIAGSTLYVYYFLRFAFVVTVFTVNAHNANGVGEGKNCNDSFFPIFQIAF